MWSPAATSASALLQGRRVRNGAVSAGCWEGSWPIECQFCAGWWHCGYSIHVQLDLQATLVMSLLDLAGGYTARLFDPLRLSSSSTNDKDLYGLKMSRRQWVALFAFTATIHLGSADDVQLTLIDSPDSKYFVSSGEDSKSKPLADLSAVVTSLLKLAPLIPIDEATSQQVTLETYSLKERSCSRM